jgi:hypothetical protein
VAAEVDVEAAAAELGALVLDELEDVEPPQAPTPAATARQERMVSRRRTPGSLPRLREHRGGSVPTLGRADARAHLYCRACPHTTF